MNVPNAPASPDAPTETAGWVLVVDDHPLFCDALELTLRTVTGYRTIRTAGRLSAALDLIAAEDTPALVFLDLNLPDVDGLDGLVRLKAAARAPIVVVSSLTEDRIISAAFAAGASGFVPKHSPRSMFQEALDAIAAGQIYRPPGFVEPGDEVDEAAEASARLATLTNQQSRILQLICEGKLNKQIAYELSIAETTVKAHVTAIMRKLGVQSRTQAVLIAQEAKFSNVLQSGD